MAKDQPIVDEREEKRDIHFPRAGADSSKAFWRQPNRPIMDKSDYARSALDAINVRGYDPQALRYRGGSRRGTEKFMPLQVSGEEFVVQNLNLIVTSGGDPVQTSQSGRVVTLVSVSQGRLYYANAGEKDWTESVNNTGEDPPLNFTGIMFSAANQQKLWFADGINWCYFNPADGTLNTWAASAGALPEDSDENTPRLICTWRGRTVLSGLLNDGGNWFMSAVDDPTNFDYAPLSPSPADAVAGNNGPAGLVGDLITALIPYTDDILIFGADHSIWMMKGDPLAGGSLQVVSSIIGMAWGEAWTLDPFGNVYFFSNRMGIYRMVPGEQPQRISQAIDSFLLGIDTGTNSIRLLWNDRFQGFHVFITPLASPAATTHLFYEARTGAWWFDKFANHDHDPLCCCIFDGNLPSDRVALIGSWDGYVRAISVDATTDDGKAIESSVVIGPFLTANLSDVLLKDLQAALGEESGDVTFEVMVGRTAEEASRSEPILTGTWSAGRNLTSLIRQAAHAIYIRISSTNPWAIESIRLRLASTGKVRERGY